MPEALSQCSCSTLHFQKTPHAYAAKRQGRLCFLVLFCATDHCCLLLCKAHGRSLGRGDQDFIALLLQLQSEAGSVHQASGLGLSPFSCSFSVDFRFSTFSPRQQIFVLNQWEFLQANLLPFSHSNRPLVQSLKSPGFLALLPKADFFNLLGVLARGSGFLFPPSSS